MDPSVRTSGIHKHPTLTPALRVESRSRGADGLGAETQAGTGSAFPRLGREKLDLTISEAQPRETVPDAAARDLSHLEPRGDGGREETESRAVPAASADPRSGAGAGFGGRGRGRAGDGRRPRRGGRAGPERRQVRAGAGRARARTGEAGPQGSRAGAGGRGRCGRSRAPPRDTRCPATPRAVTHGQPSRGRPGPLPRGTPFLHLRSRGPRARSRRQRREGRRGRAGSAAAPRARSWSFRLAARPAPPLRMRGAGPGPGDPRQVLRATRALRGKGRGRSGGSGWGARWWWWAARGGRRREKGGRGAAAAERRTLAPGAAHPKGRAKLCLCAPFPALRARSSNFS